MSRFFDWLDCNPCEAPIQKTPAISRVALHEKLNETIAYRRNLDRLIGENMAEYQILQTECDRVNHLEDSLRDDLYRMPR